MLTATIQLGNTDDKLTQVEWAAFVLMMKTKILENCVQVHFFGGSCNWERWQNVCWIVELREDQLENLKAAVKDARETFRQDSVAFMAAYINFL